MVLGLLAAAPAWLPSACAVSSARVSVAGAGAAALSSDESLPQAPRAAAERAAARAIGRRAVMGLTVASAALPSPFPPFRGEASHPDRA